MDHKNQKSSNDFLASPLLKKIIPQLLLSLSIFSFVFSYSSLYSSLSSSSSVYSPKFQSYNFSANSFPFLSRALNKNCLFLICNGLLVFLVKTSGLVHPPPGSYDLNDVLQKRIVDSLQVLHEEKVMSEESTHADQPKELDKVEDKKLADDERSSEEVSILIPESSDDEGRSCWLFYHDDAEQPYGQEADEEEEEGEEELEAEKEELSTQELNQKFEDFIRRMKEEIIINEAKQKVVMLN